MALPAIEYEYQLQEHDESGFQATTTVLFTFKTKSAAEAVMKTYSASKQAFMRIVSVLKPTVFESLEHWQRRADIERLQRIGQTLSGDDLLFLLKFVGK